MNEHTNKDSLEFCVDCGEFHIFDADTGLCFRCTKDAEYKVRREIVEDRIEFECKGRILPYTPNLN